MAELIGKKIICDKCGTSAFLKCIGEGEADGGYTRWNKFEPAPEGWDYHRETGTLCPECSKQFNALVSSFLNEGKDTTKDEAYCNPDNNCPYFEDNGSGSCVYRYYGIVNKVITKDKCNYPNKGVKISKA